MSEKGVRIPNSFKDIPSHELFACDPPKVIYHYTDFDGAKGIIESKSLWLTKLAYLNDTTELRLTIDLFRTDATNWVSKIQDDGKKGFKTYPETLCPF